MILLKKTSFIVKSHIYMTIAFVVILSTAIISLFIVASNDLIVNNNKTTEKRINELDQIVNAYITRDQNTINLASNLTEDIIHNSTEITENIDNKIKFDAVDPYTNQPFKIEINEWLIDNITILNNFNLVDKIAKLTNAEISIYQKTEKSYVNISTSTMSLRKDRLLGDVILNTSTIISSIENDNSYIGRLFINGSWYNVSYKPIYIDGKIKGLYHIRMKETIGREIKKLLKDLSSVHHMNPFVITKDGKIFAHPNIKQGTNFSKTDIYKYLNSEHKSSGYYNYRSSKKKKERRILQYKYNPLINGYICIDYNLNEPVIELRKIIIYSFILVILFIIIFQILLRFINKPLNQELKKLKRVIISLINNKNVSDKDMPREKEFIELAELTKSVTAKYRDLSQFADGLANENFSQSYPKSLVNDKLGETLIKLNDKLRSAVYNETLRRKDEKLREWEAEGLSKFVNLLQQNRDHLEELSYQLISNLVQYLKADIGALFFINSDNPDDIYFEQMATYAFEKQKYIDKKIYPEQGYIGRIINEKETIYLTEIPENYINIASGLGKGYPKNILIVPLLINNEVYGAIEIASLNIIKGFQIEFLEKMAENIASTINNMLVNNKTKELLKQSRERADLLSIEEEQMRKKLHELEAVKHSLNTTIYDSNDIFDSIETTILVAEMHKDGTILFVNNLICELLNAPEEEIINDDFYRYSSHVSVSEYKKLMEIWKHVEEGERQQTTIKFKSAKDESHNILVSFIPKYDDGVFKRVIIMGTILLAS